MKTKISVSSICVAFVFGMTLTVAAVERPIFLDKEGRALPIQDEEELLDFLHAASVTGSKTLDDGITKAIRLDLQHNDVRARAVFHHIHRNERKIKRLTNGRVRGYLRDSYTNQIAAYELGRMLEIHNIPPTNPRRFDGLKGSSQLWIENAMTEQQRQERGIQPPDWTLWNQLYADMRIFDNLINNIDRNTGNMLFDSQGHLWLIDHTRAFGPDKTLPNPEVITRCSNRLYEALKRLDEEQVRDKMKSMKLLSAGEIRMIFHRRSELLEKIEERIRVQGEASVLFDYGDLEPGIEVDEDAE